MSRTNWRRGAGLFAAVVGLTATSITASFGAYGPPHPPGEEEETGSNNLSVPAIFVPSTADSPFAGTCDAEDNSADPVGEKGVLVDGVLEHTEYYIQGDDTWQADCGVAPSATARAEWGDNLTNAPLKAGTPIRTEIGFLTDAVPAMPGYTVVKLDPSLLDRESHYGTDGVEVAAFPETRVWNHGTTLSIVNTATGATVFSGTYTAEVNSTGRVVYGYNWQKPVAGTYLITVTAPDLTLSGTDAGTVSGDQHSVSLTVTVGNKGGGGAGGGGRPPDRPRSSK